MGQDVVRDGCRLLCWYVFNQDSINLFILYSACAVDALANIFSLLGLSYGGIYGTYRGLRTAPNNMFKVRMNSIVNQTTRYGPWAANSLGVLTLSWAILDRYASTYFVKTSTHSFCI